MTFIFSPHTSKTNSVGVYCMKLLKTVYALYMKFVCMYECVIIFYSIFYRKRILGKRLENFKRHVRLNVCLNFYKFLILNLSGDGKVNRCWKTYCCEVATWQKTCSIYNENIVQLNL